MAVSVFDLAAELRRELLTLEFFLGTETRKSRKPEDLREQMMKCRKLSGQLVGQLKDLEWPKMRVIEKLGRTDSEAALPSTTKIVVACALIYAAWTLKKYLP